MRLHNREGSSHARDQRKRADGIVACGGIIVSDINNNNSGELIVGFRQWLYNVTFVTSYILYAESNILVLSPNHNYIYLLVTKTPQPLPLPTPLLLLRLLFLFLLNLSINSLGLILLPNPRKHRIRLRFIRILQ